MAFLIFLAAILALPAHAQTIGINEVSRYLQALSELEESLEKRPECAAYAGEAKIACNDITDSVCRTLWSGRNKGNMPVFDGEIASGKSKGKLAKFELAHYQALADSWPNLAPDLQEATKQTVEKLKTALAAEEDSKQWRRALADLKNDFSRAVNDVADKRQKAKYPEIMAKPEAKRSPEENMRAALIPNQLADEVLDAVYGQHPNWLRTEKVFGQAKADILASVEEMKIPEGNKQEMIRQLEAAKLTLPYTNDFGLDAEDACASTTVNAYYFPNRNELVVCAGMFNSYQSESSLYFVLAHELGHSIDSTRLALFDYRQNSSVYKNLAQLLPKDSMSCADWKKAKKDILNRPRKFVARDHKRPLDRLMACLKDRSGLKKMESAQIKDLAAFDADGKLAFLADQNQFLRIAQPTITENGELRENPLYLHPERFNAYRLPPFSDGKTRVEAGAREIFYKELTCGAGGNEGEGLSAIKNKAERAKLFKEALRATQQVMRAKAEDWFSFCGKGCAELAPYQLAINTEENAADWYASRAAERYLGRIKNRAHRREASSLFTSQLCEAPSAVTDAPELAVLEKEFSQESHPDSRLRRISLYSQEISGLVGCAAAPNSQGFSSCMP